MDKYQNLGKIFKEFRTNRHISLKQIADENVSVSQLSRFERGESDLASTRLFAALDHMHVEAGEFADAVNNYHRTEQIRFMGALVTLEYERDIEGFRRMMGEEAQKFKDHPDVYRYHLNTILLQGFICKCDSSISFPEENLLEVTDYLFITEHWSYYELSLVGNLYLFFDIPLLHKIGQEIAGQMDTYREISSLNSIAMITLMNIWETCVYRKALKEASFYRDCIAPLLQNETDLYKRSIFLFLSGLQEYLEGRETSGSEKMDRVIRLYEWLGCENLAENYRRDRKTYTGI